MSSDKNYINLGNYEEYFILYMDNELSAGERMMVEEFLSANPDLQSEMNILMGTKLPFEDVALPLKEELYAHQMKMGAFDNSLLLYIDNELTDAEKKKVEEQLKTDKEFKIENGLLLKARLDAADKISYPDKNELHHHTEKVVVFKMWMRVAAAVIIILFATAFFIINSHRQNTPVTIAQNDQPKKRTIKPVNERNIPSRVVTQENVAVKNEPVKKDRVVEENIIENTIQPQLKSVAGNDNIPNVLNEIKADAIENKSIAEVKVNIPDNKKPIAQVDVTNQTTGSYPIIDNNPSSEQPVAEEEPKTNKGSITGFLRKATRFIERRTGIETTNDNNELLIGAVAVKLK